MGLKIDTSILGTAVQSIQPQTVRRRIPSACLIIEDSAFDRERLCRVVRKTKPGLQIEQAAHLGSAREVLEAGNIAVILLDNNLPDGLGADFAIELAKDPQLSKIPIIMVSDWPSPFMWQKAAMAGVAYVLSKADFDGRYLISAMENITKRRIKRMN